MPTSGSATPDGTTAFRGRHAAAAQAGHFRPEQGLWFSSIGIGTYLGQPDEATDRAYEQTVIRAVELGANVIDTAINYRLQRSERAVGAALGGLFDRGFRREELVLCTKAGFLTPDGDIPPSSRAYFEEHYLRPGIMRIEEVAAGVHCMAPRYLADQMERSLRNLGVECVDVFYVHNPETQLAQVSRGEFDRRLRAAFELLESMAAEGKIRWYGTATWNAYRVGSGTRDFVSLEQVEALAREVGGQNHHFRFVQLPYNLAMPEAFTLRNQPTGARSGGPNAGGHVTLLQAARDLGITVIASASLMQASLAGQLPPIIGDVLSGLRTDAQRALQFVRSTPGIAAALVGMKDARHVEENLALAAVPPAPEAQFLRLFDRREKQ